MAIDLEDEYNSMASLRWNWLVPLGIGVTLVGNVAASVASSCGELSMAIAAHINYLTEQKDFEMEASKAIERITQS